MSRGIVLNLPTKYGFTEELTVRCSFSYKGGTYIIAVDSDGDYVCREIKWNLWMGPYQSECNGNNKAIEIGEFLLKKETEEPDYYKLRGEHYDVVGTRKSILIKKSARPNAFKPSAKYIPMGLRLFTAMFLAAVYAYFFTSTSEIVFFANVLGGLTRNQIILLIYLIQVLGAAALFLLRKQSNNEWSDMIIFTTVPILTAVLIGALKISSLVRLIVLLVFAVTLLIAALPRVIRAVRSKQIIQKKDIWKATLRKCRSAFFVCIIVVFAMVCYLDIPFYTASGRNTTPKEEQTVEWFNALEMKLPNEKWEKYDVQEKLDILQSICDYECANILGCSSPKVVAGHISSDNTYGSYDHILDTININIDVLEKESSKEVLNTLLHETRHKYQRAVISAYNKIEGKLSEDEKDLICFKQILSYRDNFDRYTSGEKDFDEYYYQTVESDCRSWAAYRIDVEYRRYLNPAEDFAG